MKILDKYIKLYEKPRENEKVYTWSCLDEYLEEQEDTYTEFLKKHDGSPNDVKIQRYLYWIKNPYLLGLYESFKTEDWRLLNNTIHQNCRHRMLSIDANGYDHSGEFWKVMDCMGCNDTEALEKAYPEDAGLCSNGYPTFVVASNLLFVLWYQNDEYAERVIKKARKIANQKKSLWEKAIVAFLVDLYDKDMEEASVQLNQVCKSSRRIAGSMLYKIFCLEAHGLYNIARNILTEELFEQIKMPEDESFINDFAIWQKRENYPHGEPFISYPEGLDFMNQILQCSPPESCLEAPYTDSKKKYIDVGRMRKELAEQMSM